MFILAVFKKHVSPIVVAVLIASAISIPNIYFKPFTTNTNLAYMEEETYIYAAHVRQILNGYSKGDTYLWEYRNSPSPFLGEIASIIPIAILSKISGSVVNGFLLSDLIFPLLLFFVIFVSLTKFGFGENFSTAASLATIAIPYLSMLLPHISSYGTQLTGDFANAIFFSRTPHPQVSAIYLFSSIFLTAWIFKNQTPKLVYLWAALLGVSLYSSPFAASTVFLTTFLLSPFLLRKISIKDLAIAALICAVIVFPFLLNMLSMRHLLIESDFLLRTTFPVHFLFPRQIRFVLFALLVVFLRKDNLSRVLAVYIISGSLLIDGHQILFGRNLEADHWITRVLAPISTLSIFLITDQLITNFKFKAANLLWIMLSVAIILIAFSKQLRWTNEHYFEITKETKIENLVNTIEDQTSKNDVIGSLDPELSKHITGLTGRRVYLAPGDRTLADSKEQIERICDLANIYELDPKSASERSILNYALGFGVWSRNDVGDIQSEITKCKKDRRKYKLNYLIKKDKFSDSWQLIPIN